MNPKDEKKIEGFLASAAPRYHVSAERDSMILSALHARMRGEEPAQVAEPRPSFWEFLAPLFYRLRPIAVSAFIIMLMAAGVIYSNRNSYIYHFNQARAALNSLQQVTGGSPVQMGLIPAALADGVPSIAAATEGAVDEKLVAKLVTQVVDETEAAINIAEKWDNPTKIVNAFEEISTLQASSVEVFADAIELVQDEPVANLVAAAIDTTGKVKDQVEEGIGAIRVAQSKGKKILAVNVRTTSDRNDATFSQLVAASAKNPADAFFASSRVSDASQVQERVAIARAQVESLKEGGAPIIEVAKLEARLGKAEDALDENLIARAAGLSGAVDVAGRQLALQVLDNPSLIAKLDDIKTGISAESEYIAPESPGDELPAGEPIAAGQPEENTPETEILVAAAPKTTPSVPAPSSVGKPIVIASAVEPSKTAPVSAPSTADTGIAQPEFEDEVRVAYTPTAILNSAQPAETGCTECGGGGGEESAEPAFTQPATTAPTTTTSAPQPATTQPSTTAAQPAVTTAPATSSPVALSAARPAPNLAAECKDYLEALRLGKTYIDPCSKQREANGECKRKETICKSLLPDDGDPSTP